MNSFEITILDFIRESLSCPFMDGLMKAITFFGNAGWFWIALGLGLTCLKKTRKMGITLCLALLINLLICNITLKPLVARIRPFDFAEGIQLIIAKPSDFSFPSGHTSASFAGAAAVFAYNKKYGTLALVFASLIAFSRLYLYVHFPSDVLAGALVGAMCAVASFFIVKTISKKLA